MRGAPLPRGYAVCFRTSLRSLSLHRGKAGERAVWTVALSIYFSEAPKCGRSHERSRGGLDAVRGGVLSGLRRIERVRGRCFEGRHHIEAVGRRMLAHYR